MDQLFLPAAQLGGTVFTVCAFLWYLTKKDTALTHIIDESIDARKMNASSNLELARTLQKLTDIIERNTKVNIENTDKISENVGAVKESTDVIKKNTDVIKKNGNGKH